MKYLELINFYITVITIFHCCLLCCAAVVHKSHDHGHHDHKILNKERESDGAYSPKEKDLSGGQQHSDFDHEAILGSVKEAEEYDQLPPEEAKKRLAILATKIDVSKDGHVDRDELRAWILHSFSMLSEEEAIEKLEDADENHDGKLSWLEYLSDTYGVESDDDSALEFHEENLHLITEDKEMWQAADQNGDGILDLDEWKVFSSPEDYPEMVPIILNQTLRNKDKDNDGSISFQEYIGDEGKSLSKEALQSEKYKFDVEYDKNKDGKLTGSEVLSWMVPSNEEIAEDEVLHLIAHSDDNDDGLLSYAEIVAHHETFVGSEATDYGDHLHNIHQFDDEL